jgi:hypothetical protein
MSAPPLVVPVTQAAQVAPTQGIPEVRWVCLWDASLQRNMRVIIPTTLDVPQSCVRQCSGRAINHSVDLKYWTCEQFLEMGAPFDLSDFRYFWKVTQDKDRILYGGPHGSEGQQAFQRLVYMIKKQEELWEMLRLETEMEEKREFLDPDGDGDDQFGYQASINRMELRIARLRKEPLGSSWHYVSHDALQTVYGLSRPGHPTSCNLYHATSIWPCVTGIFP